MLDRRYPVTLPTIQMSQGKQVFVLIDNPLQFETLSLDLTSATALPGTEQLASLVTAAVPQIKGFETSNVTTPGEEPFVVSVVDPDQDLMNTINNEFLVMQSMLDSANAQLPSEQSAPHPNLYEQMRTVYEQLNQATAPIPRPGSGGTGAYNPPLDAQLTPNPWTDYGNWRNCLMYELVGGASDNVTCKTGEPHTLPAFSNVLGAITALQGQLPSTPPAPAPANPVFNQTAFEDIAKHIQGEIRNLHIQEHKDQVNARLKAFQGKENTLLAKISVVAATLTNVQKDFVTYYQNILMTTHGLPLLLTKSDHTPLSYSDLGPIDDPQSTRPGNTPVLYARFLGRSVTYAVNEINTIATAQTSVAAATAKVSIATVTVLYANPRLESSAGAIVSFVHNRTFANQTLTTPPPGSPCAGEPGCIVIAQTKTDPEVVPFVALHWRIRDEYLMPDHRRGAAYGSIWVGLNPYSLLPEYGGGPTFSWRSLMFSFLYNRAHQTSLISGETVGTPICFVTPPSGSTTPPCTPAPPAPITQTTPLNAFAIGVSVRIPTSFAPATATGGVSR
jgi:hypothetical protein